MNNSKQGPDTSYFPRGLLEDLSCPYCGSRLDITHVVVATPHGVKDGVLRCDCYEYPVVAGIVLLRQMSPVSSIHNEAVECLRQNDTVGALSWLLENGAAAGVPSPAGIRSIAGAAPSIFKKFKVLIKGEKIPLTSITTKPHSGGFKEFLKETRSRGYAEYLYYRFAYPSLLGSIPPLVVFGRICSQTRRGRLVDLLCGVGHASAILKGLWPEIEVIAADYDFVNLYLLKSFIAPGAAAICIDAELPLPFAGNSVDGFFCLDGLHYVRSKIALLRELERILGSEGICLFAHLHNVDGSNVNPGTPLSANGYLERFSFGQYRMMPEIEALHQFKTYGGLDLTRHSEPDSVAASDALMLFGGRREGLWQRFADLDKMLCRKPDLLGFNPIYQAKEAADGIVLKAAYPSDSVRRECTVNSLILAEEVHISAQTLNEIKETHLRGTLSEDVRKLIRSFVIVPLPNCYPKPGYPLND